MGAAEAPVAALLEEFAGSARGELTGDPQLLFAVGADGAARSSRNS
jgi:hypothetical protein